MELLKKNWRWVLIGALIAFNALVWYAVAWENREGVLTVAVLDVGQGDAIFIDAPNGNQVLVDGGPPNGKVLRELGRVMPFYDREIDVVALTHPHLDHYGGLDEVRKRYTIGYEMNSQNTLRGTRVDMGGGVTLTALLPVIHPATSTKPHDQMLVFKLRYASTTMLLTGDMEKNLEHYLVELDGKNLKSDVLKVGHHGSKTSTSEELLGYADPALAVISVGEKNSYGHPHKEVLDRLARFGIPVRRTDQEGTIIVQSDGSSVCSASDSSCRF